MASDTQAINCNVKSGSAPPRLLTLAYVRPQSKCKDRFLNSLIQMFRDYTLPWPVAGDLNDCMDSSEQDSCFLCLPNGLLVVC